MVSPSTLYTLSILLFSSISLAAPSLLVRATVSPDGTCGPSKGYTCQGSKYGNSCGKNNQCGSDFSYSRLSNGCQPMYGFCYAKGSVSPDGSCSGSDMFICIGSNFGNSCGPNNLCGRDAGYSGTGCQPQYGYCAQCTTTVPPSTTTITVRTTTTSPVTVSATTTSTVKSGVSSITTTATVTTTSTTLSTTTTTATITPDPVTTSATVTTSTTISSGTVTVTTTNGVVFQKRGGVILALPLKIAATTSTSSLASGPILARLLARATALSCGTVISTGFTTTTTSTTTTLTTLTTTTTTSIAFTTVPSTTSTITATSTITVGASSTITSTVTTTAQPSTVTLTSTTTVSSIVPAATTTVGVAGPIYSKAYERTDANSCFYSGSFFAQVGVSDDPSNQYQTGVTQCAAACSASSQCQSFYFSDSTDPTGTRGAYCLLSSSAYAAGSVQCNYQTATLYLVDYNKVQ